MNEERELRLKIVEKIIDKSTFNSPTGMSIAEYSKIIESYILTGELPTQAKSSRNEIF